MGKSVYIWGTGIIAGHFFNNICKVLDITGFVESFPQNDVFLRKYVCAPDELLNNSIVFVANTHFEEILNHYGELLKRKEVRVINTFANEKVYLKKEGCNYSIVDLSNLWLYFNGSRILTNNEELFHKFELNRPECFWEDKSENIELGEVNYTSKRRLIDDWLVPKLSKKQVILDIGCSNGVFDEYLAPYVGSIDAYDYSSFSIIGAKESAYKNGISNIHYYCEDMKSLKLQSEYDVIMTLGTLCYCESTKQMQDIIQKMRNALKPQGVLVIVNTVVNTDDECIYYYCYDNNYHAYYYGHKMIPNICDGLGLELKQQRVLFDDYLTDVYKPIVGWEFVKN